MTTAACALHVYRMEAKDGISKVVQNAMLGVLALYRKHLSPMMAPNCRFVPSCSVYMMSAIQMFGPWKGALISAWRLVRCNPTGGSGYDPPQWPLVPYNAGS